MLSADQIEFYNRWSNKAGQIGNLSTEDCIDKYVSYFIIYNFLYCLIPEFEARQNNRPVRFSWDRVAATDNVVGFFGGANLGNVLQQHVADITELHTILDQNLFNISFNRQRTYEPHRDRELADGLISSNTNTNVLAVLNTMYNVRCNIVHGKKGLQPYQTLLLQPLVRIIYSLNQYMFNSFSANPIQLI